MKINLRIPPAELAVGCLTCSLSELNFLYFSLTAHTCRQLRCFFKCGGFVCNDLFPRLHDHCPSLRSRLGSRRKTASADLLLARVWHSEPTHRFSCKLSMAARSEVICRPAAAGVSPSIYALVDDAAPPDRRATWLALTVSGLLVSLALGASPAGLVGATFGWAALFVALAGFSLALVALNCWVWPSDCSHGGAAGPPHNRLGVASLTRHLMPMIVWGTGLYGVYTYLGAGFVAFGFSKSQVARAVMVYGAGRSPEPCLAGVWPIGLAQNLRQR